MNTFAIRKAASTLILIGLAATTTSNLMAASPLADDVATAEVQYFSSDLTTAAGARILYNRLVRAAKQVCSPLESRQLDRHARWSACHEKALAEAVAKLNEPQVTALYQGHHHTSAQG